MPIPNAPTGAPERSSSPRWRRLATAALCLILAAPVALDFWFIHAFGVNVPYADSWNGTLPFVRAFSNGTLTLAELWAPHNESRMLFPKLILAIVDSHTRANQVTDMYLSAIVMTAALALLLAVAVRSTRLGLAGMVPIPFLFFSLAQVENILWAFQFAWMLVLLCLVVSLCGLESSRARYLPFAVAVLAAVVASFSSLQGLLLWPAGLIFAIGRGVPRARLAFWCTAGVITGGIYAWHFGNVSPATSPTYALFHPSQAAHYFLRLMGGMVPAHQQLFAILMLAASCLLALVLYHRRTNWERLRLPLALWLSGVLFDLMVTVGRLQLGVPGSSRYTTYSMLVLIGLYLAALVLIDPHPGRPNALAVGRAGLWPSLLGFGVVALVVVQIATSLPAGIQAGEGSHTVELHDAQLLLEYRTTPNAELASHLFPPTGAYVRIWAGWLQSRHWSVFAPPSAKGPVA
jgi:hypothetical protein